MLKTEKPDPDENKNQDLKKIGVFLTIPFVLAISPIFGWLIGKELDKLLKTTPYLTYLFLLLGFMAGFRELYRLIKRFGDE